MSGLSSSKRSIDGIVEGNSGGDKDGRIDGLADGASTKDGRWDSTKADGIVEGDPDGRADDLTEGPTDGRADWTGFLVGLSDPKVDGNSDGWFDGGSNPDGSRESLEEGC